MPSTSTSRPPLFVLVTRASTIRPLRRFSQLASTAAPLSERISRPSSVSNRSTTTSIMSPGLGSSPWNCSTGTTPSLLAPRSMKTLLPRTLMTLPVLEPGAASWPRWPLGTCSRSAARVRGVATSNFEGSKPAIAASSSASRSASHCRFERDFLGWAPRGLRGRRVEGGIDRVVLAGIRSDSRRTWDTRSRGHPRKSAGGSARARIMSSGWKSGVTLSPGRGAPASTRGWGSRRRGTRGRRRGTGPRGRGR